MSTAPPPAILEPPAIPRLRSGCGDLSLGARVAYGAWLLALFGVCAHVDACPFGCQAGRALCADGVHAFDDEHARWMAWDELREQSACNGPSRAGTSHLCGGTTSCQPPVYDAACPYHGAAALRSALEGEP